MAFRTFSRYNLERIFSIGMKEGEVPGPVLFFDSGCGLCHN